MSSTKTVAFEVCVETPQGIAACQGLADRIELCSGLDLGGLTPSHGLMRLAKDSGIETHVLIRPRAGDFSMSQHDLAVASADIAAVREMGLQGVVIGAVKNDALDTDAIATMIDAAEGLDLTLHRAFDVVADRTAALEQAIDLGFRRVLTSGGSPTAPDGAKEIQRLYTQSKGRIEIMAGSGISPTNLHRLLEETKCDAIHASCTSHRNIQHDYEWMGFGSAARHTDPEKVRMIAKALQTQKVNA